MGRPFWGALVRSEGLAASRKPLRISFHGTEGQDAPPPFAERPSHALGVQRPLPVGKCSVALGHVSARADQESLCPTRLQLAHSSSARRLDRRSPSLSVLRSTGTTLPSGPSGAMASFGKPRGHSLLVGPPSRLRGAMKQMDTSPRTLLVASLPAASRPLARCRSAECHSRHRGDDN